jgi:sugar lactone lactonase YvrE
MRRRIVLLLLLLAIGYFGFWPVPVEPVAWQAPAAPELTGIYAENDRLASIRSLGSGIGSGPEDVAIDATGRLYVGYADGRITRFDADGGTPALFANTGGRPLGLDFDAQGRLLIADARLGLLRVAEGGKVEILSNRAAGVPFGFTDDVDVGADGMIYFSDASSRFGVDADPRWDIVEHRGNGRLLRFDPASGETSVLLHGLQFANGVAVAPDASFVLVVQTGDYSVLRYWLSGPRAGQHEVFIDNLPGFPDGISSNGGDTYWLALYAPRLAPLDWLAPYPGLRKALLRLPDWLQLAPKRHAFVLGLSSEGKVVHNLQHRASDSYAPITSVEEANGRLYLGTLEQAAFGVIEVPPATSAN